MIEKLIVLAFFVLIHCLRMHYAWHRCREQEQNKYRSRDGLNAKMVEYNIWIWMCISWLATLTLYFNVEDTPTILQICIGFLVISVGAVIASVGRLHLNGSWANENEVTEKFRSLIKSGIYGIVRNPIYVGLVIMLMGYGISMGITQFTFKTFFAASAYFVLRVWDYHTEVLAEERFLLERHGLEYQQYLLNVGRYFPKILRILSIVKVGVAN